MSDIAGNDIKAHGNEPLSIVRAIRSWFAENSFFGLPSHNRIWEAYGEFLVRLSDKARELGYEDGDYSEMPITEYIYLIKLLSPPLMA